MIDTERAGEMEQRHDGRIAAPALEIAEILLRESGDLGEPLLGEAFLLPKPPEIPPDQPAHIHARKLPLYTLSGLSLIVCIVGFGVCTLE